LSRVSYEKRFYDIDTSKEGRPEEPWTHQTFQQSSPKKTFKNHFSFIHTFREKAGLLALKTFAMRGFLNEEAFHYNSS